MPPASSNEEWEFPRLKASIGFEVQDQDHEFFDVRFYPFLAETEDPVFAAISKKHVLIYRLSTTSTPFYEIIRLLRDDDDEAENCSCTWSVEPETELPWLCVAGVDRKVKVYDVFNGTLVKVLVGHGEEINDLVTCPTNPLLIASASQDTTVRLWSLDPADEKQPCVCILGGEGHSSGLLTVAFHNNGQYVLSAGHDNCVCLWTLPDLSKRPINKNPPPPIVVHYPHFFTSEVHSGIVDCVAFYGDLIISRACHENIIVLWRIEGFSSRDPIPPASSAPTTSDTERLTRSAFAPATASSCLPQYTRLAQFFTPGSGHQFYMRFRLFLDEFKHPILAFANASSQIFFWDLARLIEYQEWATGMTDPQREGPPPERPSWLLPLNPKQTKSDANSSYKGSGDKDSVASGRSVTPDLGCWAPLADHFSPETVQYWNAYYDMTCVEKAILAHNVSSVTIKDFIGRQIAWSPGGEWCVVVGSKNLAIILQRWQQKKEDKKPSSHIHSQTQSRTQDQISSQSKVQDPGQSFQSESQPPSQNQSSIS